MYSNYKVSLFALNPTYACKISTNSNTDQIIKRVYIKTSIKILACFKKIFLVKIQGNKTIYYFLFKKIKLQLL